MNKIEQEIGGPPKYKRGQWNWDEPAVIPLTPSLWKLHVWVGEINWKAFRKFYEAKKSEIKELQEEQSDFVTIIRKGNRDNQKSYILLRLNDIDPVAIVHEIQHILWYMHKYTGAEMTWDSQEWQAMMAEYLFAEIIKIGIELENDY